MLRSIGEASADEVEVFGGLLTVAVAGFGVLGGGEESRPRPRRRVAFAEVFGECGVGVDVVPLDLRQEPLDGHRHELGSAEGGHVAEDMGRVEPLSADIKVEDVDEFLGDLVEDAGREVVVAEELLIAFQGACGERDAGFEVQGILNVGSEDVGFDGLLSGPVEEVGQEDEAGHGIEFFGGSAEGFTEVLGEVIDGHDLEDGMSKNPLPAVADDLASRRWNDPFK
ncbi:MAG: hypothetical protein ACP5XB_28810 [Isosphaeraceae bacterium]